ncbi:MAG: hypothetical protein KDA37_18430, partial [Planctomycetales bacterium]|nr:hypothetical protein [Planctomycetales bacterium]
MEAHIASANRMIAPFRVLPEASIATFQSTFARVMWHATGSQVPTAVDWFLWGPFPNTPETYHAA